MTEVTAEMIERGRGADPRSVAERRRIAVEVREARDRLTSSGTGHRAFDLELLRLYAERRRGATPGLVVLSVAFAAVAAQWTNPFLLVVWLAVNAAALAFALGLAKRFRSRAAETVDVRRWSRGFIATETLQGCAWALLFVIAYDARDPYALTFLLVALLLVAAMNATVTASIPAAVLGNLTPMTLAVILLLHPTNMMVKGLLLIVLAIVAQFYFLLLARRLRGSTLQALSFQAEKDDLIAELEQSKAKSEIARRRAEESNLAKSRFLATMSHELRTPLNAILGFSEVMKGELFGKHAVEAYKDYASDIHASGEHLLMVINEILDLSRVEAGRYDLHEESIDLQGAIEECRHLVVMRAKKKNIQISQDNVDVLPRLWGDIRAIRQVALNLLSNAIKFTPQGGSVRITVGSTAEGGQFFSIVDNGAGIPDIEIPVIMASFGRGSLAHKNAEEGTGLGIPIVRGLVELHNGTFELKSKVRQGTEVVVSFPPERVMSVLPRLDAETLPARAPGQEHTLARTAA